MTLPKFRLEGEQISAYVHNQYLQAWVEMGIVGALIYILLIVLVLRQAHRAAKADVSGWSAGIFAGISASAVAAFLTTIGNILQYICSGGFWRGL